MMDENFPVGEFQTDNRKQNMTRSMISSSVMHNYNGFVLDVISNICRTNLNQYPFKATQFGFGITLKAF